MDILVKVDVYAFCLLFSYLIKVVALLIFICCDQICICIYL